MPFAVAYKNAMLDSGPPDAAALYTANPGSTGTTNEVTGGSPAYARKTLTWAAASGGSKALAATFPVFDVPATTVTHVGFFRSGVYQGYVDVTDEVFASQGTYTITAGSIDLNATASA